ncbi:Uncharacterised protein [Mycobacteroides abscessus subsp. abscessus]|nr:Uncharacterised protein [Mycobacteroides abscessus subsp. abscessus]
MGKPSSSAAIRRIPSRSPASRTALAVGITCVTSPSASLSSASRDAASTNGSTNRGRSFSMRSYRRSDSPMGASTARSATPCAGPPFPVSTTMTSAPSRWNEMASSLASSPDPSSMTVVRFPAGGSASSAGRSAGAGASGGCGTACPVRSSVWPSARSATASGAGAPASTVFPTASTGVAALAVLEPDLAPLVARTASSVTGAAAAGTGSTMSADVAVPCSLGGEPSCVTTMPFTPSGRSASPIGPCLACQIATYPQPRVLWT